MNFAIRSRARIAVALLLALMLASCAWLRSAGEGARTETRAREVDASPVEPRPADSGLHERWQHGAFVQIDVRAYQDSDGDGVGDLKGLVRRLDHLKELGARGILLMPIQPGSGGEGVGDTIDDPRAVDPAVGTLADVDELLAQAHARGIGVVMDYALNHSSTAHPFFVDARRGASSAYRDWYVWANEAPKGWEVRGRSPWHAGERGSGAYYGVFGAARPDYNFRNPKVVAYHLDNLRFWLNRGVDGFRLLGTAQLIENDAARWFDQPESRRLAALAAQTIRSYPKRFVACDAPVDTQAWAEVCGSAFAQELGALVVQAARGEAAAVGALAEQMRKLDGASGLWISSADDSAGNARLGDEVSSDAAAYRLAAATYLLLPGVPFVHYGEEVGQEASTRAQREPMSWASVNAGTADGYSTRTTNLAPMAPNLATANVEVQRQAFGSIFDTYRDLIDMRNRRPSVAVGGIEAVTVRGQLLSFVRAHGDERTLVVINYGARRVEVDVAGLPRRARVAPIYPRRAGASQIAQIVIADGSGRLAVDMPPRSARAFDVEPQRRD